LHKNNVLESLHSLESTLSYLKYRLKLKKLKQNLILKTGGKLSTNLNRNCSNVKWENIESAFNGRIRTGFISTLNIKDPLIFFNKAFKCFSIKIKKILKESMIKVNVIFSAYFIKPQTGEIDIKSFCTKNVPIDTSTNLKRWYKENVSDKLMNKLEEFAEKDSGWALHEVTGLTVNINRYDPLKIGFSTFVTVPNFIKKKHAVINVENDDNFCFLWSVVSALYPAKKNANRISSYPHFKDVLKYQNIQFPITIKDVRKFEKHNNLAINLYCFERSKILPCSLSSQTHKADIKVINLLMLPINTKPNLSFASKKSLLYHFVWIKNLSRLLSKQLSNHNNKCFVCERCLNSFTTDNLLQNHLRYCLKSNQCCVKLPDETKKFLQFENHSYKEKVPFVIYADLESILEKASDNNYSTKSNSKIYQNHVAFSVAYYLKCSYNDSFSKFNIYRGKDCIQWFVKELEEISQFCDEQLKIILPMTTITTTTTTTTNDNCHICKQTFQPNQMKVRDHNHQTGEFRGLAHQACNLNYKDAHYIPVVFHNLSGYDAHFIIKELSTQFQGTIKLLPINKEKYISFTKYVAGTNVSLRFVDSFRFMSQPLGKLSSNLQNEQKSITKLFCNTEEEFLLLTKKGIFPYDYIDSFERLEETVLPCKEAFYSELTEEPISDSDYYHAKKVWDCFHIKTIGEYADLYLKTDVLLLADVFEAFRDTCKKTYDLDPLHYFTTPGLTFDAMLKTTNITLERLMDIDQILFIEKGIRGGVSQCSNRYAKANNKYMRENFIQNLDSKYLMYFDVNNLYGAAMSEYLPYGEFEFLENFNIQQILYTSNTSQIGYILECDLDYPICIHDMHSDLPLAPEHMVPPNSTSKIKKLLLTLFPKKIILFIIEI
jgi:hypothetical protein